MWFQIIIKTFISTLVFMRIIEHVFPNMDLHCYEERLLFFVITFTLGFFFYTLTGKQPSISPSDESSTSHEN